MVRRKQSQKEPSKSQDKQGSEKAKEIPATSASVHLLVKTDGVCPFTKWFGGLRDSEAKSRILVRIVRLIQNGNLGDRRERIAGAVSELKINYGPGYRVYYVQIGDVVVVLQGGGVKDGQQADIDAALKLWEENKDDNDRFSRVFGD